MQVENGQVIDPRRNDDGNSGMPGREGDGHGEKHILSDSNESLQFASDSERDSFEHGDRVKFKKNNGLAMDVIRIG